MAAPKKWGYTRDKDIPDEILVSWSDGDLTEAVVFEVVEHLLGDQDSRRDVAAWARTAHDTSIPVGKDWIAEVRSGLMDRCLEIGQD